MNTCWLPPVFVMLWLFLVKSAKPKNYSFRYKMNENEEQVGSEGKPEKKPYEFSPAVQECINELMPSNDPLLQANFNVTDYINTLFPTEQSLSQLDETIAKISLEIQDMDTEMADLVHAQGSNGQAGQKALEEAKVAIQELFSRMNEIKAKTELSESMVKEMTRDIKSLDVAKRNLTQSVKTLNHLHLLLGGLEQLSVLVPNRQYGEIANLLPGILNVLLHFKPYMTVSQVKQLSDQLHELRQNLSAQVVQDFKAWFGNSLVPTEHPPSQVLDLCRVVSCLEPSVKVELSKGYISRCLAEYHVLFADTEDNAWLDTIDQRFKWFTRRLIEFEGQANRIFPEDWDMARQLTLHFCTTTKEMLNKIIAKRINQLDTKLLIHAIQQTTAFERTLCRRFPPVAPTQTELDNVQGSEKLDAMLSSTAQFKSAISSVFENYMHVYVSSTERNISDFLDKAVNKFRESQPTCEACTTAIIVPSCSELFLFYKNVIKQAQDISSNPQPLIADLVPVFKKYLKEFTIRCLTAFLPKISTSQTTTTTGLIHSLLKEGEIARLSKHEYLLTCCILTSAEFCAETTKQLEQKLKEKVVDPALVDMSGEIDMLHSVISSALTVLVQDLDMACDAALQAMCKTNWSSVDTVGDESGYVVSIKSHMKKNVPVCRDYLANARKYFIQFCLKFANTFIGKFHANMYRCKSLSVSGAEQLLLDAHSLKSALMEMPTVDSLAAPKPPSHYTKVIVKGMTKAEMILKVVMFEYDSPQSFVDHILKLIPECDATDMQRILEMKCIRRADQLPVLEELRRRSSKQLELATPLINIADSADNSKIRKLEKLVKKRL